MTISSVLLTQTRPKIHLTSTVNLCPLTAVEVSVVLFMECTCSCIVYHEPIERYIVHLQEKEDNGLYF